MEHDLDLCQICGQGYDGASVISGKIGGVQKMLADSIKAGGLDVPVPFVHGAARNLNLVINDAAEANIEGISFFGTISIVFDFFGLSLNRWVELAITEEGWKKLKIKKKLCTTRWSSRIEAVRAIQKS